MFQVIFQFCVGSLLIATAVQQALCVAINRNHSYQAVATTEGEGSTE